MYQTVAGVTLKRDTAAGRGLPPLPRRLPTLLERDRSKRTEFMKGIRGMRESITKALWQTVCAIFLTLLTEPFWLHARMVVVVAVIVLTSNAVGNLTWNYAHRITDERP